MVYSAWGELSARTRRFRLGTYRVKKRILGAENLAGTVKCWRLGRGGECYDVRVIMREVYFKTKNSPIIRTALLARYRGVPEEEVVRGLDCHPS